jgi:hypothetical protein
MTVKEVNVFGQLRAESEEASTTRTDGPLGASDRLAPGRLKSFPGGLDGIVDVLRRGVRKVEHLLAG